MVKGIVRQSDAIFVDGVDESPRSPARHPDLHESELLHGVTHTTGGRRLPGRKFAVLSNEEQEQRLADPRGWQHHVSVAPSPIAQAGARDFNASRGRPDPHAGIDFESVRQTPDAMRKTGRDYDALPDFDPAAVPSYDAFRRDIGDQFNHATKRLGIRPEFVDHDPYRDIHDLTDDVNRNKRLKVLKTATTGGHPYLSDEDNDKFRFVHDLYGHAATGRSFDRHGEQAAYLAHSGMFSPEAQGALATETRGQNGSLILNGEFPKQKVALLPEYRMSKTAAPAKRKAPAKPKSDSPWMDKHGYTQDVLNRNALAWWDGLNPQQKHEAAYWYPVFSDWASEMAQRQGLHNDKGAGVVAATSPLRRWDGNLQDAHSVLVNHPHNQGAIKKPPGLGAGKNIIRAKRVMDAPDDPAAIRAALTERSDDPDAAKKITNFHDLGVNPEHGGAYNYADQPVVIDSWMPRGILAHPDDVARHGGDSMELVPPSLRDRKVKKANKFNRETGQWESQGHRPPNLRDVGIWALGNKGGYDRMANALRHVAEQRQLPFAHIAQAGIWNGLGGTPNPTADTPAPHDAGPLTHITDPNALYDEMWRRSGAVQNSPQMVSAARDVSHHVDDDWDHQATPHDELDLAVAHGELTPAEAEVLRYEAEQDIGKISALIEARWPPDRPEWYSDAQYNADLMRAINHQPEGGPPGITMRYYPGDGPKKGDPGGGGYMVSPETGSRAQNHGTLRPEDITNYIEDNADHMDDGWYGGWYDDETPGEPPSWFHDRPWNIKDRGKALQRGKEQRQRAIYDIDNNDEIRVPVSDEGYHTRDTAGQEVRPPEKRSHIRREVGRRGAQGSRRPRTTSRSSVFERQAALKYAAAKDFEYRYHQPGESVWLPEYMETPGVDYVEGPAVTAHLPYDDTPAGFISWQHPGGYEDGYNPGEVKSLSVHRPFRRSGMATGLFNRAQQIHPEVHHSEMLTTDGEKFVNGLGLKDRRERARQKASCKGDDCGCSPTMDHLGLGPLGSLLTLEAYQALPDHDWTQHGIHSGVAAEIFDDPETGFKWLFKHAPKDVADKHVAESVLQALLGIPTAPSFSVGHPNSSETGLAQLLFAGAKDAFPDGVNPHALEDGDLQTIAKLLELHARTGDHTQVRGEDFVRLPNGSLVYIHSGHLHNDRDSSEPSFYDIMRDAVDRVDHPDLDDFVEKLEHVLSGGDQ